MYARVAVQSATHGMYRHDEDAEDAALLTGPSTPWGGSWTPARVIQVLEQFVSASRRERLRACIDSRIGSVTVVLDAPHDPHNGAAVTRSADAFGVPQVHIVPREESFRIGRTAARGAERWVELVEHPSPDHAVRELRDRGFTLVATHADGALLPDDLRSIPRVALIFGNEHDGVREQLFRACDAAVRIPMRGFVESLNVSVAAGVLLHAATAGRPGDLTAHERERLYARGLFRSVQRAADILEASQIEPHARRLLPRGSRSV